MYAFVVFLISLALFALGYWYLTVPLDVLWQQHERRLLANGLALQRNAIWEQRARSGSWLCIGVSMVILLFACFIFAATNQPKMSGVRIDGRELTQQQWDSCGYDTATCVNLYYQAR